MPGGWVIFYSPRPVHPDGARLQAFTAIGRIGDRDLEVIRSAMAPRPAEEATLVR